MVEALVLSGNHMVTDGVPGRGGCDARFVPLKDADGIPGPRTGQKECDGMATVGGPGL